MTYILSKIALIVLLNSINQNIEPVRMFERDACAKSLSSYQEKYNKNKFFIKAFELPSLIALSYYPELKDVEIQFIRANIKTTMETRPTTNTTLKNKNRCYTIFVDNNTEGEGTLLDSVPFNAQIGVLGHEFAHILDYEKRNSGNLAALGLSYLTNDGKMKLEKQTDHSTIWKGLGWQLYDWSDFVLNKSKASEKYKAYKRQFYLQPNEIEIEIKKNAWYKSSN
jgi:hypothetical protein